jgi:hypothetical protein
MTDVVAILEQGELDILTYEVSDDALEASAAERSAIFTLAACTGLSACPA